MLGNIYCHHRGKFLIQLGRVGEPETQTLFLFLSLSHRLKLHFPPLVLSFVRSWINLVLGGCYVSCSCYFLKGRRISSLHVNFVSHSFLIVVDAFLVVSFSSLPSVIFFFPPAKCRSLQKRRDVNEGWIKTCRIRKGGGGWRRGRCRFSEKTTKVVTTHGNCR